LDKRPPLVEYRNNDSLLTLFLLPFLLNQGTLTRLYRMVIFSALAALNSPNNLQNLNIKRTTFHGLRDTHASYLLAQDLDIAYVSNDEIIIWNLCQKKSTSKMPML